MIILYSQKCGYTLFILWLWPLVLQFGEWGDSGRWGRADGGDCPCETSCCKGGKPQSDRLDPSVTKHKPFVRLNGASLSVQQECQRRGLWQNNARSPSQNVEPGSTFYVIWQGAALASQIIWTLYSYCLPLDCLDERIVAAVITF